MTAFRATESDPVTAEFVRDFVERYVAAWNSHDAARLLDLCAPDVRWEDPFIPAGRLEGHDGLREWAASSWRAIPDLAFTLDGDVHLALDGRSSMAAWTGTGTMTGPLDPPGFAPTGERVRMEGVDTHWYRDGRLVRVRTVSDTTAVARQIGAAPLPGTRAERAGVVLQRLQARRRRRSPQRARPSVPAAG